MPNTNAERSIRLSPSLITWDRARLWVVWLAIGLALGWTLAIVWWAVLVPNNQDITDELVIPLGTGEAIRTGSGAAFVPAQVSLRPGSRLIVVNQDTEEHTVGNAVIPPGAVAELSTPDDGEGFYCTIHPSGFLGVNLTERPSFLTTIIPALFVGLPIGLITAAASWIGKRLDIGDGKPLPT